MACECAFLQAVFPISSSAALRKQQEGELGLKERWYLAGCFGARLSQPQRIVSPTHVPKISHNHVLGRFAERSDGHKGNGGSSGQ